MSTRSPASPGAAAVLSALHDHGLTVAVDGHDLVITPRHLLTPALRAAVVAHKPDLLTLLASESGASSPAVERHAQQQGESHVPVSLPSHALSPAPCSHAATYRRPSGVLVCLDCGAAQVPGNPTWHRQHPLYCDEGQHVPYADTPADHPRQCMKCPYVWDMHTADSPRDPAVHDPHCAGMGLVVVPSWGWSCPQCNGRYVVPEAPASSAPAHQAALPMENGVPHGEVVPSKRRR